MTQNDTYNLIYIKINGNHGSMCPYKVVSQELEWATLFSQFIYLRNYVHFFTDQHNQVHILEIVFLTFSVLYR